MIEGGPDSRFGLNQDISSFLEKVRRLVKNESTTIEQFRESFDNDDLITIRREHPIEFRRCYLRAYVIISKRASLAYAF